MWFAVNVRGHAFFHKLLVFAVFVVAPIETYTLSNAKEEEKASCVSPRRVKRDDLSVLPFDDIYSSDKGRSGYAAYFSGAEIIRFHEARISAEGFTVEFWVRPEGGQYHGVPIITFFDRCDYNNGTKGWSVGFEEEEKEKELRVYFALESDRSKRKTTILSHKLITAQKWFHVAATYNGKTMKLYVEQAKVAVSHKQVDSVPASFFETCKTLEVGGNSKKSVMFRGAVDNLRIWNRAKSQTEINDHLFDLKSLKRDSLDLYEDFDTHKNHNLQLQYTAVSGSLPERIHSTVPEDIDHLVARKPLCGNTVCDNPEIIRSYVKDSALRPHKNLRYRLINIADDNGLNPIVTPHQMKLQNQGLNQAFAQYNISWDFSEKQIRNTSLRKRTVLDNCEARQIGDNRCQKECRYPITGDDGGDCDEKKIACEPSKRGNGKCNMECNRVYHMWDGGDCCNPKVTDTAKTCVDPKSPFRAYLSVSEYKALLDLDNTKHLNVFVIKWTKPDVHGWATLPWDKEVYGVQGGTMLNSNRYGKPAGIKDMIHELGHNLGLWHVHRGVSELSCTDECFETHASMELGDLCSDTRPTPEHSTCRDPEGEGSCEHGKYTKTPYHNYMSYADTDGTCSNHFTPQQTARMHCYIDMAYQIWLKKRAGPSGIPLPPRILSKSDGRLTIGWLPPIGFGKLSARKLCHQCEPGKKILRQFAITAKSSVKKNPSSYWPAKKAVGPPNASACLADFRAWIGTDESCKSCYLELGFEKQVIPTGIRIWVVYSAKDCIKDIQLLNVDGSVTSLGPGTAQCDEPYTRRIVHSKHVNKVRIHVNSEGVTGVGIDAVQLESEVNHAHCQQCEPIEYIVARKPPFSNGKTRKVTKPRLHDIDIKPDEGYEYRVKATYGPYEGPWSSPLNYFVDHGYCGNGRIEEQDGEECDDGNVRDGDGCNIKCKKEDVFHCKGQPSLCYRHESDGICEEFERATSIQDCGFYTPPNFADQWAISVKGNPKSYSSACPVGVIAGPPPLKLKCVQTFHEWEHSNVWGPCIKRFSGIDHWIEASFEREVVAVAVVLYIGSDGKDETSRKPRSIRVTLIDSKGTYRGIGRNHVDLSCNLNPMRIPILHDMSKPFFKTRRVRITFSAGGIAIAALALRSSAVLDPVIAANCEEMELYNRQTHSCFPYKCERPFCKPLGLKNANIKCNGQQDGHSCQVTCNPGYLPRKTFTVTCVLGEWKKEFKECKPVDCGKPQVKHAVLECAEGTTLGKFCNFYCKEPATMIGKDNRVTCLSDGLWSAKKAICHRQCSPSFQVPNSMPIDHHCNGMKPVKLHEMGTECKFRCLPGYYPKQISPKVAGDVVVVTCDVDGKWQQDSVCKPVMCRPLPLFESLIFNCTLKNHYGSVCRTTCPDDGSLQEVRCQSNAKWSSSFKLCKYKGHCGKIKTLANISLDSCSMDAPGSTCTPRCTSDTKDIALSENDAAKKRPTLVCLPNLKWHPNPSSLLCVRKCKEHLMGDGYCDCINNRKYCGYDGNDCCLQKPVFLGPGPTCACADPNKIAQRQEEKSPTASTEASGEMPSDDDGKDDPPDSDQMPTVS